MNDIAPFVRHMLLCDDADRDPKDPGKVNIFGLLTAVSRQGVDLAFPVKHSFTVYLVLTGGRGEGEMQIVATLADSGAGIYESPRYSIRFDNDPLKTKGVIVYVHTCSFPQAGLYWVEFWYNGKMLAHEALEVR
jgi:hypothetical protein